MKQILRFIKKETVLTIAWAAAIISAFFVPPDPGYLDYIDLRSLGILWSLMVIMEGLKENGFFSRIGSAVLKKTHRAGQLAAVLIFLCFFLSMLITNDVALITFVPFALYMLKQTDREDLLIPVVVLQTIAANLGSMLTPVGNPQNLYLYGLSGMSIGAFLRLMLPYSALTLGILIISICFLKRKNEPIREVPAEKTTAAKAAGRNRILYGCLFVLALLVVMRWIPYWILAGAVLVVALWIGRRALISVDYALLLTFVGFFIFTGNLGNIPAVRQFLTTMIGGREVITGVISSQAISNVPAALLLSRFTQEYSGLIIGVNLGGLGTLIASMASLISFKVLAHNYNEKKGRYLGWFTLMNLICLGLLLALYYAIR